MRFAVKHNKQAFIPIFAEFLINHILAVSPLYMPYSEEIIARQLYQSLLQSQLPTNTTILLEVAGVHCYCKIVTGQFSCYIHCFDSISTAQYYSEYQEHNITVSTSRTEDKMTAIDIALMWMKGTSINRLHSLYECIDTGKRKLISVHQSLTSHNKNLKSCNIILAPELSSSEYYMYIIQQDERAIQYDTQDTPPDEFGFHFLWGDQIMFTYQEPNLHISHQLINQWLLDQTLPSTLKRNSPGLHIKQIAFEYEKAAFTEGEFYNSWDWVERSFNENSQFYAAWVLSFLLYLREKGYDKQLHAHISVGRLVLNRIRRPDGNDEEAPWLIFTFQNAGLEIRNNHQEVQFFNTTVITSEILSLLNKLCEQPVNMPNKLIPLDTTNLF